jgi:hypothetical protein
MVADVVLSRQTGTEFKQQQELKPKLAIGNLNPCNLSQANFK